ncbi:hypothetical protein ACI8AF_11930 [Blastococcus sp. SYSU D00669]
MDTARTRRGTALAALLAVLTLTGCSFVVIGRPGSQSPPTSDVGSGEITVVGATDDPVDARVRNALADLQDFWSSRFPDVFGTQFQPLQGGFFSVDPDDVDPAAYPQGIGCGTDPRDVEGNAFYCSAPDAPHSDSISYDRAFLGRLADEYGRFLPDLVTAHEFGHAIQARVGSPQSSIATETQADCLAGAWTGWVADGEARYTQLRPAELDQLLQGYLLLRDPVGTSPAGQAAHGSGFDRVSAFQEGFDDGPAACRDDFGPERVFTQSPFTTDQDFANRGNAPYGDLPTLIEDSLTEFWEAALPALGGSRFEAPELTVFRTGPPACAVDDLDLVYCADGPVVGFDDTDLGRPLYGEIGDYAVITAVSIGYALAARDQLGLAADGEDAYRSAVCLTGWFSAELVAGSLRTATVSPGDLDESVQFLLQHARDPAVLPDVDLTGFELVDLLRNGFVGGPGPCDVQA